jgi:antiviral helicase SLH1
VIKLPPASEERKVGVVVLSDSYIGMQWKVENVEVPAPPRVVDDGLKKG